MRDVDHLEVDRFGFGELQFGGDEFNELTEVARVAMNPGRSGEAQLQRPRLNMTPNAATAMGRSYVRSAFSGQGLSAI